MSFQHTCVGNPGHICYACQDERDLLDPQSKRFDSVSTQRFGAPPDRSLADAWYRLPAWARVFITWLDKQINEKHGGEPGETISRRAAKSRDRGELEGIVICTMLDRADPGHCDRALLGD